MRRTEPSDRSEIDRRIDLFRRERRVSRALVLLISLMGVLMILGGAILGISRVDGDSMHPFFQDGDIIIFQRNAKDPAPGDVVVFERGDSQRYVKRIVAKEGDYVDIDDESGMLLINGIPAVDSSGYGRTWRHERIRYPLLLREDEYFVLGDNRESSRDSRDYGAVQKGQIIGIVRCRIW